MKKNGIYKSIMWIIALIPSAVTAVILPGMPDNVPMHFDINGNVDRWGSKYEELIVVFTLLAMTLSMHFVITFFEKKGAKAEDEKTKAECTTNAKVASIAGIIMAVFSGVAYVSILCSTTQMVKTGSETPSINSERIICVMMGVLFIVLGNIMTRTRRNALVGFRCGWTQYNDNTWKKSNRFGAILMMIAGVLALIMALVMDNPVHAMAVTVGMVILITIATLVYAHRIYVIEKTNDNAGEGR
ncbi:MAG: SdpI family protein [Lachnospiraceae bacterium]|nr:SdpI family protein [Lachnospiraceae bacterium]